MCSMLDTAYCLKPEASESFNLNQTSMGLVCFLVVHCPDCEKHADVDFKCPNGASLECFYNVFSPEKMVANRKLYLKDLHAVQPTPSDLNAVIKYFMLDLKNLSETEPVDSEKMANVITKLTELDFSTTGKINDFMNKKDCEVNFSQVTHTMACQMLAFHYQTHCNIRFAAWEGGHHQLLATFLTESWPWTIRVPISPQAMTPPVPGNSPLHQEVPINFCVSTEQAMPQDFYKTLLEKSYVHTKATTSSLKPTWQTVMQQCLDVFQR